MKNQTNQTIRNEHRPRTLRSRSTDVERIIWQKLRGRQVAEAKFRRQHALGNYIVDFVSFDAMLVVELDGGQHQQQHTYDQARDDYLQSAGFCVLRFWNNDVLNNCEGVMEVIFREVLARRLTPSPTQPPP